MAGLDRTLAMLEQQRRELVDQLAAVDTAIAAMTAVVPRRVTPRRVLSDAHREAVVVGKRKARHAHEAAKGLVREMPDDAFVPAIGRRGERQAPRLVKRTTSK